MYILYFNNKLQILKILFKVVLRYFLSEYIMFTHLVTWDLRLKIIQKRCKPVKEASTKYTEAGDDKTWRIK